MASIDITYPNDDQNPIILEVTSAHTTNVLTDVTGDGVSHSLGMVMELPRKYPIAGVSE